MISCRVGFVFNKLYFILLLLFCILKAYSRYFEELGNFN